MQKIVIKNGEKEPMTCTVGGRTSDIFKKKLTENTTVSIYKASKTMVITANMAAN